MVVPPAPVVKEPPKEKPKQNFIAPQDKAKRKMVNDLFGGMKGPSAKPAPPKSNPQPAKKQEKVETADLI